MDPIAILSDAVDLKRKLEMLQQQETFLNINPKENSPLYWIFLSFKCLIAGYGTKHLLNINVTMAFVIGTFINSCINMKFWLIPALSIGFGAATFAVLKWEDGEAPLPTLLWIGFCLRIEGEFYMDIYLVLCFLALIFKLYDKECQKAVAFIFTMMGLNWMADNEEIIKAGKLHLILASYIIFFFLLRPAKRVVLEDENKKRKLYVLLNAAMYLLLLYKCYRNGLGKNFEDAMDYFRK